MIVRRIDHSHRLIPEDKNYYCNKSSSRLLSRPATKYFSVVCLVLTIVSQVFTSSQVALQYTARHAYNSMFCGRNNHIVVSLPVAALDATSWVPDYGGLEFTVSLLQNASSSHFGRILDNIDSQQQYHRDRAAELDAMDQVPEWRGLQDFATVDDLMEEAVSSSCHPPSWRSLQFPTCNSVHEVSAQEMRFLGYGSLFVKGRTPRGGRTLCVFFSTTLTLHFCSFFLLVI